MKNKSSQIGIRLAKIFSVVMIVITMSTSAGGGEPMAFQTDHLRLVLDGRGFISDLSDPQSGESFLHRTKPSPLICVKLYEKPGVMQPKGCRVEAVRDGTTRLRFMYEAGAEITVAFRLNRGWIRMEVEDSSDIKNVEAIIWGPINTLCEGPVGNYLGLVRTEKATLGMMTLDPNTDGVATYMGLACAGWLPWEEGGSYLALHAQDHTRPRKHGVTRTSTPVPGFTVIGSAVALYAVPRGEELTLIEKIEKAEGLPHPICEGEWSKTSRKTVRPGIWAKFTGEDVEDYAEIVKAMGGVEVACKQVCANYGHFDQDRKAYPQGEMRDYAQRLAKGVGMNLYTYTLFTKPLASPEPYISPVPDPRLLRHDAETTTLVGIDAAATAVRLKRDSDVSRLLARISPRTGKRDGNKPTAMMLWINNEFINAGSFREDGDALVLEDCVRGSLMTIPAQHEQGARVRFVCFMTPWNVVFPGTMEMSFDVARNIAQAAKKGLFTKVTLDGVESGLKVGHGPYVMNRICRIVYDANADREIAITGSRLTGYSWHIMNYISWGEHDTGNGFRGSMLDRRLGNVLLLTHNLMPHKMGQYYGASSRNRTLEDFLWLGGLAAGWDASMEFVLNAKDFKSHPGYKEIIAAINRWEKARLSGKLTEEQKMLLQQPDCVYDVKDNGAGGFELVFIRRWRHLGVKILPSSTLPLTPVGKSCRIEPATVGIDAMHSPLVGATAALSEDIVCDSDKAIQIKTEYPGTGLDLALRPVLRVPHEAPAGIVNPRFCGINGQAFVIPTEIQPGQYVTFPADMAMAFLYNSADDRLLKVVYLRHANDLPRIPRGKPVELEFFLPSSKFGVATSARVNLYSFEPRQSGKK